MAGVQLEAGSSQIMDNQQMEDKLNREIEMQPKSPQCNKCSIGMVDNRIRVVDTDKYEPHYVSIGAYHMDKESLARNKEKVASRDAIFRASRDENSVDACLRRLRHLESKARGYYQDPFPREITSEEFVDMLLLDGCYILHRFVRSTDATGGRQQVPLKIVRDVLYLLENQIPFFVLEEINRLAGWSSNGSVLLECTSYVDTVLKSHGYVTDGRQPQVGERKPSHLLHLLHMHLAGNGPATEGQQDFRHENQQGTGGLPIAPSGNQPTTEETQGVRPGNLQEIEAEEHNDHRVRPLRRWRRATEYHTAACVLFESVDLRVINEGRASRRRSSARSILDVELRCCGGLLVVPNLYIDNDTWCILRNLIALEQHNAKALGSRITAYCMFMSQVACTKEDVELLSRKGLVDHLMGEDNHCAKCFSDLCKGVIFDLNNPDLNYLRYICEKLDQRFRSLRSNWMAWMLLRYCRNPCVAIGLMVGIIVLVCTVLQAVFQIQESNK